MVENTPTVRLTVLMRFCRLSEPESEAGTPRLKKATQLSRGGSDSCPPPEHYRKGTAWRLAGDRNSARARGMSQNTAGNPLENPLGEQTWPSLQVGNFRATHGGTRKCSHFWHLAAEGSPRRPIQAFGRTTSLRQDRSAAARSISGRRLCISLRKTLLLLTQRPHLESPVAEHTPRR